VLIYNNTIRSSASAIKFGTYTFGGCKNIRIINNRIYDTYRSAVSFQMMDGNVVEDIIIDSLRAINTGNVFFFRLGERKKGRVGTMKNIQISNIYAEVPAGKPDASYPYEGPIEHMPRNISPAVIVGLPQACIKNLSFQNIEIHYPGGADSNYAKIDLSQLDSIPELPSKYPEFSMFKELPAWGFYIRHVRNIHMENIRLFTNKIDFRKAIILDDVQECRFKNSHIGVAKSNITANDASMVYQNNCKDIKFEPNPK